VRARDLSESWLKEIGSKLKDKVEIQAREDFQSFLKAGNKLTYRQLRKVNSVWKKDYAKAIMNESDTIKEYVKDVQEKQHYIAEVEMKIEDM